MRRPRASAHGSNGSHADRGRTRSNRRAQGNPSHTHTHSGPHSGYDSHSYSHHSAPARPHEGTGGSLR
ncbi:MAG: hypothetical protein HY687_04635 [Chloroflexi bacterium]|nr:hypothetical protein [Chloroflexota bacterium]